MATELQFESPGPPPCVDKRQGATVEKTAGFWLTPARLRVWGMRSALSLMDQGLTSGSSFLLNVLLARWLSREAYGAFAALFTAFLFLSGFHNVVFVEPMTVIGSARYPRRLTDYFNAQLRVHLALVGILGGIGLLAGGVLAGRISENPLGPAVLAASVSVPLLLSFLLARRMCYVVQDPGVAVQASAIYSVLLFVGAFDLRHLNSLTPVTAFLLMAVVSVFASVFILVRLRVSFHFFSTVGTPNFRQILRENWAYGHWLTVTTALSWISLQAQTLLTAALLGFATAGAFRAMQLPSFIMTQIIAATMLLVLPSMSQELSRRNVDGLRKKAILSTIFLSALGVFFVAGLFICARPLERLMFGSKYLSSAWLIPVLGLAPLLTGLSSSLSLALRALGKSHFELFAYVLSALTALSSACVFMPRWGLPGAAASVVGSALVLTISVLICFLRWGTNVS